MTQKLSNTDLPKLIISKVIHDDSFCKSILPFVKTKYFEGTDKILFKLLLDFVKTYNKRPTKTALEIEAQKSSQINEKNGAEVLAAMSKVFDKDFAQVETEWLKKTAEEWCKQRALFIAVVESFTIITEEDRANDEGTIPDLIKDALAVSFDNNIGHDYTMDAFHRYEYYNRQELKCPFDIEKLNEITNGGVSEKTLNLLVGGVNVGKTLALTHLAAGYLSQGKNVLYITLEMAEMEIARRIDANLLDLPINQIQLTPEDQYLSKVDKIKQKTNGKLIIKEYPTASAHAGHFRALLNDIRLKKGYTPDVVLIDYLGICASSRFKGNMGDSYSLVKAISEELRGLAVEFKNIFWSAMQFNRCLDPESIVIAQSGMIKLDQVEVGDKLKTVSGWNTVKDKWESTEELYEIKTESGKTIRCSRKHLFPDEDGNLMNIETGTLTVGKHLMNK